MTSTYARSLVAELVRWRRPGWPLLFGIAGGVGVGKTTVAASLADEVRAAGLTVAVVCTDGFLFPNDELSRRGLLARKGFPDTFDVESLVAALDALRKQQPADVPVYSHETYDRLPDPVRVEPADVVIVEGVNVLQAEVAERLHSSMWIEAHEPHMRAWFFTRFDALCETGEGFYAPLAAMTPEQRRSVAEAAWTGINLVNFEQHIRPTKYRAMYQLQKNEDHSVRSFAAVGPRRAPQAGRS
ncbi:MAG TPA: hypothetical protein VF230_12815 [Acidimicrobiales bacterium]